VYHLPAIRNTFGHSIANDVSDATADFSGKPAPTETDPRTTTPFEVTTGLQDLSQSVGSADFVTSFLTDAISRTQAQASHLFESLSDKSTILFLPCALCTRLLTSSAPK
jgi:hypothetical protein